MCLCFNTLTQMAPLNKMEYFVLVNKDVQNETEISQLAKMDFFYCSVSVLHTSLRNKGKRYLLSGKKSHSNSPFRISKEKEKNGRGSGW